MKQIAVKIDERVRPFLLAALLILLLATGCAPAAAGQRSGEPADVTIVYRREGGLAGRSEEWVIHLDGRIDAPGNRDMQVPPAEVVAVIEQGEALDEPPATLEPAPCCDRFTYTLTFIVGDSEKTFVIYDGAETDAHEMQMFTAVEALLKAAEPLP